MTINTCKTPGCYRWCKLDNNGKCPLCVRYEKINKGIDTDARRMVYVFVAVALLFSFIAWIQH